eukprot:3203154-Rhodomonas_salina.1
MLRAIPEPQCVCVCACVCSVTRTDTRTHTSQANKDAVLDAAIAAGRIKLAAQLEAMNMAHFWVASEVRDRVEEIASGEFNSKGQITPAAREAKITAMKEQWNAWREWARRCKQKFPYRAMPGGKAEFILDNWIAGFIKLVQHPAIVRTRKYRDDSVTREQNMIGAVPDLLSHEFAEFSVSEDEMQSMVTEIKKGVKKLGKGGRSAKHRAQYAAVAADQAPQAAAGPPPAVLEEREGAPDAHAAPPAGQDETQ